MEQIGVGKSANALFDLSRSMRGQSREFAEDFPSRDVGAIRGFMFALLFEGLIAIIAIALLAWFF